MLKKVVLKAAGTTLVLAMFAGAAVAADAPAGDAAAPAPPPKPKVAALNQPVPDFTIKTYDGGMLKWTEMKKGKPMVINFMQTACSACLGEMNYMKQVKEGPEGKKYDFYTVAIDLQEAAAVKRYLTTYTQFEGFNFLLDKDLDVMKTFGFASTPSLALITADGKLAARIVGYSPEHEQVLMDKLKALK